MENKREKKWKIAEKAKIYAKVAKTKAYQGRE
jgi:hypothetical protein